MEKEDLSLVQEWMNNREFMGEFLPPTQYTKAELGKTESSPFEPKVFIIERKDGSKIGYIAHYNSYLGLGKLLVKTKRILVGKEEQTEDKAPVFKYQNPNAWSRALPDSVYENAR
jgi:hypothetical protein